MSAVYSTKNVLKIFKSKRFQDKYQIDKYTYLNLYKVKLSGKYTEWGLKEKGFLFWKTYYVVIKTPIRKCFLSIRLEKKV